MRFLLIDDSPAEREQLVRVIQHVYPQAECMAIHGRQDFEAAMAQGGFDAVLTEHRLSWTDGLSLLSEVQAQYPHTPVVMLTASGSELLAVEGMRAGLSDYVPKTHLHRLPEALQHSLERARQVIVAASRQPAIRMQQVTEAFEPSALLGKMQRLQEQYRVVTENLHDAVHMVDRDGHIVFANPALARLTGYDVAELLGRPSTMLYAPDTVPPLLECQSQAWRGQEVSPYLQVQMVHKDGKRLAVEVSLATLSLDGQVVGRVAVARDITARLQLEAQLRQAQKMQAIGTLTGGIAHDFNNILTVILGYTELTLDDVPQDSQGWRNLKRVMTASERAKVLVQQMLAFSRQVEQERQPVQLRRLVKETLPLVRATLPATITLRHNLDATSGPVLADPLHLHQVLTHLCTNAEYAMRQTGGELEVALDEMELPADLTASRPDLVPGPYVRLSVRDTGPGITPEILERIFEPFFTTKDVGEGTGLGLAVVHGIVTHHGGALTVESTPGQGATFAVYLPRRDATTSPSVHGEGLVLTRHERILLVDDEEALTGVIRMQLTHLGYDVVMCASGQEALEVFCKAPEHFDVVITDQTMPHMTGEALARELRRVRPDIPIILCTGFSHVMSAEKAQTLGLDAFCMKPLKIHDLGLIIRQVLERRATQSA